MRLAKRWHELEANPDMSLNQALRALAKKRTSTKPFDRDDLLVNAAFREFLRSFMRSWTRQEKAALERDLKVQDMFANMMEELRFRIRLNDPRLRTEEDIKKAYERGSKSLRIRLALKKVFPEKDTDNSLRKAA